MYIRKQGLKFQLLRRVDIGDEKIHHETLGSIPVSCKGIDEVNEKLRGKLTKREEGQLEEHLEKYRIKVAHRRAQKSDKKNSKELNDVMDAMDIFLDENDNNKENPNIKDLTALHKKLTHALCNAGQSPEITANTLEAARKPLDGLDLKSEDASIIIREWVHLRKVLNKQGYTSTWYNNWRNPKKIVN